jgi:Domain of unknown function (DUF5658)
VLSFPIERLDSLVLPLLAPYLILNFLDVASTLIAMQFPSFVELNPIAAALFSHQFTGFIFALVLKYSPAVVVTYIAFMKDVGNKHPLGVRMAKISAIMVLIIGNAFYVYVVGSNLGNLFRLFF